MSNLVIGKFAIRRAAGLVFNYEIAKLRNYQIDEAFETAMQAEF
jgi:hypothetical protein